MYILREYIVNIFRGGDFLNKLHYWQYDSAREKQMLIYNSKEINIHNHNMITVLLLIHTSLFLLLFMFTSITNYYGYRSRSYFICSLFLLSFYLLLKVAKSFLRGITLLYLGYIALFLYCMYSSRVLSPDTTCSTILALLSQFPLTIMDKKWRINFILLLFTISYIILVIPYKCPDIAIIELVNVVGFAIMSSLIGGHLRASRLEALELRRIGFIRETTDSLTNLPNRRKLFDIIESFNMDAPSFTNIAMLDIDFFKLYNDGYGHQCGDSCLRRISKCFASIAEEYPVTFYRYGGEEFMAIINYEDPTDAKALCHIINQRVYDLQIKHIHSGIGYASVSIGLASLKDLPPDSSFDTWICAADSALYGAKSSGKNTTFVYPYK